MKIQGPCQKGRGTMLFKILKYEAFPLPHGLSLSTNRSGFYLLFSVVLCKDKFKLQIISMNFTVHLYIVQYQF